MRRGSNAGAISGILGILSVIAGVIMIIAGNNIYNNFYEQVEYYYRHGGMDDTGKKIVTGGIILIAVGAILLFVSLYFLISSRRQLAGTVHGSDYDEFDDMVAQLAGNKTIFDVFHSEDNSKVFSFSRDKTCKLKENGEIYHGKMEALEWESGHPTLWRITLDYKGHKEVCEVSKVEGNILVKNSSGQAVFYRG